ncbi:1-pyrroline-5-carboxylate dehydrogenase [Burkholderia cenocepacia]|uniref:1-pyrroline-5-carboxylate dehydrogenase n=1 Tax=Burkholderia cenocepacia TaxID=95486 RepID=UPI00209DCAFA|nr:1-pyrroline-5-carboxylate dehydrogenase [Burkholderia cenocepacia]MCO8321928.1 1-pyrroline-5-carboxylate dehydrogenase [Burkholderia cenocepacia]MCO8329212.1 1-pyrroline-5-carboxylate dehydrogenase [Burkholderia cenocepacia]MCO8336667.1 1-pyrroline-5-carboxylate dehydrogenase [Burkholderia cenocepacia]MCO8343952.1 1-pyrroline-5-carboxylate dehydrogenase [Burkholderia cenocepacia]MCO8357065.1 1-pyrroline-5-carboxylate dehydrogenase [Burkholderia cenocepacia]
MREDIEKYLAETSEATAKAVATGTGLPHLDVTKELNRMLGEAIVEREKRAGGGNEYVYWLARAAQTAPPASDTPPADAAPALVSVGLVEKSLDPNARVIDVAQIIEGLRAEVERLTAERDAAQQKADTWRANTAALEARIDELTLGPVGARAPLFVTVGRYCKPRRHASLEKAQRRGSALVRSEKESEVLVLEPVGRIVRGTQWMPR